MFSLICFLLGTLTIVFFFALGLLGRLTMDNMDLQEQNQKLEKEKQYLLRKIADMYNQNITCETIDEILGQAEKKIGGQDWGS